MDVVFCTDNNYVMPCGITMISLLENNKGVDIAIHIVGMNLTDDNKDLLQKIGDQYSASLYFYDIDKSYLSSFCLAMNGPKHITIAAYIRLFLAEILPNDIEKVLYLDCDLIVNDRLTDLWNINMQSCSVMGTIDAPAFIPTTYKRLGYPNTFSYINTGVLLINLQYWRSNNVQKSFENYLVSSQSSIIYHDQDVINAVLFKSIKMLPFKYNVHNLYYLRDWDAHLYQAEVDEARSNPAIIHFSTGTKPWVKGSFHPLVERYIKYKDLSPWKDVTIGWGNQSFSRKFRYYKRKFLYGLGLSKPRYICLSKVI